MTTPSSPTGCRRQLALCLEPPAQAHEGGMEKRTALIEALAELLLEALGEEITASPPGEGADEPEAHR